MTTASPSSAIPPLLSLHSALADSFAPLQPHLEFILLPLYRLFPTNLPPSAVSANPRPYSLILQVITALVEQCPAAFSTRDDLFTSALLRGLTLLTGPDGRLSSSLDEADVLSALALLAALAQLPALPASFLAAEHHPTQGHWTALVVDVLRSYPARRSVLESALAALAALLAHLDPAIKQQILPGTSSALLALCRADYKLGSGVPSLAYSALSALVVVPLSLQAQHDKLALVLTQALAHPPSISRVALARLDLAFRLLCTPHLSPAVQSQALSCLTQALADPTTLAPARDCLARLESPRLQPLLLDLLQTSLPRATLPHLPDAERDSLLTSCQAITTLLDPGLLRVAVDANPVRFLSHLVLVLSIDNDSQSARSLVRSIAHVDAEVALGLIEAAASLLADASLVPGFGPAQHPALVTLLGQICLGRPSRQIVATLLQDEVWADSRTLPFALAALADCAEAMARDFPLVDALFPLLEYLPHPVAGAAASQALDRVASACGYASTNALLETNIDYVVDALIARLPFVHSEGNIAGVVESLLDRIHTWGLDEAQIRDLCSAVLASLDDLYSAPQRAWTLLRALDAVVTRSPQLPRVSASSSPASDSPLIDSLLRQLAPPESPVLDHSPAPGNDPPAQDVSPESPSLVLTARILSRATFYFSHADMAVRRQAFILAENCLYKLPNPKPHVHSLWPTLILNINQHKNCLDLALDLFLACVETTGEFMTHRLEEDLWPLLAREHPARALELGLRVARDLNQLALLRPIAERLCLLALEHKAVELLCILAPTPLGDSIWLSAAVSHLPTDPRVARCASQVAHPVHSDALWKCLA